MKKLMKARSVMSDLISRKSVEKIIKEFFKTKVDEIQKREKFNKLCDLCDLYLELNADLHKVIEDIPVAFDVDKVVERLEELPHGEYKDDFGKGYAIAVKACTGIVKGAESE